MLMILLKILEVRWSLHAESSSVLKGLNSNSSALRLIYLWLLMMYLNWSYLRPLERLVVAEWVKVLKETLQVLYKVQVLFIISVVTRNNQTCYQATI